MVKVILGMIAGVAIGFGVSTQIPHTVAANPSAKVAAKQPVERSKAVSRRRTTTLPSSASSASKRPVVSTPTHSPLAAFWAKYKAEGREGKRK